MADHILAPALTAQEQQTVLLALAEKVRQNAYCPYSHHAVGAALLCADGSVFVGCNMENAAYSVVCAERGAIANAVAHGHRDFVAVAVVGGAEGQPARLACFPCGVCRQMLFEFGGGDLRVIVGGETPRAYPLAELLPYAFGPRSLAEAGC